MLNISMILKFLAWHGFDEFGWNDPWGIKFLKEESLKSTIFKTILQLSILT